MCWQARRPLSSKNKKNRPRHRMCQPSGGEVSFSFRIPEFTANKAQQTRITAVGFIFVLQNEDEEAS
jgi:hypothetical protein